MSERIAQIIKQYSEEGIHRTGTAVDIESATNLMAAIEALGVQAESDVFEFQRLDVQEASLEIVGLEIGALKIEGVPMYDTTYTNARGVAGVAGSLGSPADIGFQMTPPSEMSANARLIMDARKSGQHRAIVAVTDDRLPPDGAALLNAEHFSVPFGPPVLQVPSRHWQAMQKAMKTGANCTVVAHANYSTAKAINIQARVQGSRFGLPPLVVMTPRSGWWYNAAERGGGLAAWLEILRSFASTQPERDVIFTANTGHELGHTGLDHYLESHQPLIKYARAWVHLGANFASRHGGNIRLQYSDEALQNLVRSIRGDLPIGTETPIGQRPFGEARNIFDGGGKYISILGGNDLFHHPADKWPDAVDLELTEKWVSVLVDVCRELSRVSPNQVEKS